MAGNSSIWRATTIDGTGRGTEDISESIQFNSVPDGVIDSTGHVFHTEFDLIRGIGENEKSLGAVNQLQDTGFIGISGTIVGTIQLHQPPGSLPGAGNITTLVKVLVRWIIEDNVNDALPNGRFGIRLDDFPDMNMTPQKIDSPPGTSNWGIKIQNIKFVRPQGEKNRVDFIMAIRYSFGVVGTGPTYVWT